MLVACVANKQVRSVEDVSKMKCEFTPHERFQLSSEEQGMTVNVKERGKVDIPCLVKTYEGSEPFKHYTLRFIRTTQENALELIKHRYGGKNTTIDDLGKKYKIQTGTFMTSKDQNTTTCWLDYIWSAPFSSWDLEGKDIYEGATYLVVASSSWKIAGEYKDFREIKIDNEKVLWDHFHKISGEILSGCKLSP